MESKRKKWLWGGAVLLLLALAIPKVLSLQKSPARSPGGGAGGELSVRTKVVSPQRLEETVRAIGTLSANEEVEIKSERSGKIR